MPQNYPRKILAKPESRYFDHLTGHTVAVKKLKYNEKMRPMVVAYDIIGDVIQIITIHPITSQEITNRVRRKRWIKDEKD